ncbi:MAG: GNAT family N-acetyltransferase [Acidobacteriaceae bacterium]
MIAEAVISDAAKGHLRRLDMRRDLARVADLVELCFYDTLDPEGKQYLKDMRRAAQNPSLLGWMSNMIDEAPMPPSGYVWEEDGRLVGNLSLIPISVLGKRGYMIANVATHPDYRGRGIARLLTSTALEHARQHHASSAWLQVRVDNPAAIHIYQTAGFVERLRRSSWFSGPEFEQHSLPAGVKVNHRCSDQWARQRQWLKRIYPPELEWHMPLDWNMFRPDVWGKIYRFLNFELPQHWCVEKDGMLMGVLTWKHTTGYTDPLWLAIPEQPDELPILGLLTTARTVIKRSQPLSLNLPAGLAESVLHRAGFYSHQTLIWMSLDLPG